MASFGGCYYFLLKLDHLYSSLNLLMFCMIICILKLFQVLQEEVLLLQVTDNNNCYCGFMMVSCHFPVVSSVVMIEN